MERHRWEAWQLARSQWSVVSDAEIGHIAQQYAHHSTWIAGSGSRANLKLEGLSWDALRDFTVEFDQQCVSPLHAAMPSPFPRLRLAVDGCLRRCC